MRKPNILFLMCDEHRADVTGFGGNTVIRTPNLDRLARTGVVFDNAYTPSPICIPARQCMMAGQFAKTCHCEHYGDDLAPGYMTFARQFARHAYKTVVCGKLHHMGPDQMQGWTQRIGMEAEVAEAYIDHKDEKTFREYARDFSTVKWDQIKEVRRAGIGWGECQDVDDYAVDGALRFIRKYFLDPYHDREMVDTPLLLKISLLKPHYPYTADPALFDYYLNRVEPYLEETTFDHPAMIRHRVRPGADASPREIRRATAAYYAMIEESDRQFGRVMEALEQAGQNLDDWIIVYTADHGEMLGQHGVWEKQKFYEGSARVPLVIRWPRRFSPHLCEKNVNLCDLFATLCDLAEIPVPEGLDSRILTPLLEGQEEGWQDETVSQFEGEHLMIKWGHLKYQYYGENVPELLFDLARNPEETVNYIDDPAYADLLPRFRARRKELNY